MRHTGMPTRKKPKAKNQKKVDTTIEGTSEILCPMRPK